MRLDIQENLRRRYLLGDLPESQATELEQEIFSDDEKFEQMFGSIESSEVNPKLAAVTLAFAALGKQMTGMPIDFQIQTASHANSVYGSRPRSALVEARS